MEKIKHYWKYHKKESAIIIAVIVILAIL